MVGGQQLKLFKEHVRPTKRARFVCREILPDAFHCDECHSHAQALFIAVTRIGELGCCCRSLLILDDVGLIVAAGRSKKLRPDMTHAELVEASLRGSDPSVPLERHARPSPPGG